MELVFKISESPVRSSVYQKVKGEVIRIGRAFDNDLILNDPAISPQHAEIIMDEDGNMWFADLDSLNGTIKDRSHKVEGRIELNSGSEFTLGKTTLHVYSPDHSVESAIRIQPASSLTNLLANPLILTVSVVLVALLYGMEQWLNMFQEFKWQEIINIELIIFGSALSIGIFWAIVGRIFKHEANFKSQMKILLFNTLNYQLAMMLMLSLEFVLIAALLWFNLQLATNQTLEQRIRTSVVISAALVALSIYSEFINTSEFSDSPEYVKLLQSPALRFIDGVDEEHYVSELSVVFDKLESESNQ
jgi:pSer/pThr/pTyr-binding forkhead associated (FHA) protein